jgi:Na+/proline symporter
MGLTPAAWLVIFSIHAVIGTAIGSVVVFTVLRKRTTWRLIAASAIASTAAWLATIHFSDLAGVSGFPKDGKWELLTWRQNTPMQNLLGDHPYLFGFVAAVLAAAAVTALSGHYKPERKQL